MIQKIRVITTKGPDVRGEGILSDLRHMFPGNPIEKVRTIKVYHLEEISEKEAIELSEKLFCEKINQDYSLNKSLIKNDAIVLEIAYQPEVMNPEVASILKAASDLGVYPKAADSSWEYAFYGSIDRTFVKNVVKKLRLFNPLIEHIVEKEPQTLIIKGTIGPTTTIPVRKMSDKELLELSEDKLFLNLEELITIQNYFQKIKRDPTDCELETLAQTWSEHCAHKVFKANLIVDGKKKDPLFSRIKKEALKHDKNIVSAFIDNSGVMDFYDDWAICGKAETHNSPSAIEPYGGTMTGSGGVFRDVVGTGLGAKAIASTDIFCFAPPNLDLQKLPPGSLPPDYLLKRCVYAVRDYGNRVGIPTNNGSFHFHEDFRAKPTVLVGSYGIMPKKYAQKGSPDVGDLVVAIGGRTGRDGIHGATFSSGAMTERTINVNAAAVQIGNAIEEKRMFDAILEARDKNLIRAIQDCGAGGFSSAIGEMGEETGVSVDLEKVKLKYQGLSPWEIWISESQERMVLAIPQNKLKEFLEICKKYNVEESVLGKFDGSKKLNVYYGKKRVAELNMQLLHHGLCQRTMIATRPRTPNLPNHPNLPKIPASQNQWLKVLEKVLSHGNICSKEPIIRMYDHSVQGTNDLQPYSGEKLNAPNDAAVLRPILNKSYGMIISHGLNPVLNNIDPYWGSIWAATEAMANYVAVGGDYKNTSLINNYVWPFPDEESLWSLDKSVDAVIDFMKTLNIPVISGKDSLSSTYKGKNGQIIKIPPVLCISVFGKIQNASKTISADFKKENSVICLVGKSDFESMAGSAYAEAINNSTMKQFNNIPHVNLKLLPKILDTLYQAIQTGKILSCHDISEGGIITAIFEMCLGGNIGAEINTSNSGRPSSRGHDSSEVKTRPDYFLFNETAGTFIVEVENEETAGKLFKDIPYKILGNTQKEKNIVVLKNKNQLFSANIDELKNIWQEPMKVYFP